jgi:DNA modification methylase
MIMRRITYEGKMKCTRLRKPILTENDKLIEYKDGTKYHKFNTLNNLNNKQWIKFQKSWFTLNPSPREKNVMLHPAKFPEELVQQFIEFFTKRTQVVLDPMAGTGSTLVACSMCGRSGIGVELSEKYALVAKQRLEKISRQRTTPENETMDEISLKLINGDARDVDKMNLPPIDYCITSPPYWNMLHEEGFETQTRRKKEKLDVHYSDDPKDLGNIREYDVFLDELENVYRKVYALLRPNGYLTIIVKNIKKKNRTYPLAWDISDRLSRFFVLKDERIWCQNDVKLAPYGYGRAWVSNTMHHYCLNFRKGAA